MTLEKQLHRYIIPNALATVGHSVYILADTYFISVAAGADGITALNLSLPIYSIIFATGSMLGVGFATRYTLDKESDPASAGTLFSRAIEWGLLISIPFMLTGMFCPGSIMRFMGADDVILALGTPYLRVVLYCTPFFMMNLSVTSFVRNDYAPRTAMAAMLISSFFNIVFDYILIFPAGMGITGAALATGLSPVVSMLVCLVHFFSKDNALKLRPLLPVFNDLARCCPLGAAAFVGDIASGITTTCFNYILLGLGGNVAVAAYGVIANMALVANSLFNGVAQGQQPLLSSLQAEGRKVDERRVLNHSMKIAFGIAVVLFVLVCLGKRPITNLFNSAHSAGLERYSLQGIPVYFAGFLIASLNHVRSGYFSATGDAKHSFIIAISRGAVALILFAFVLSRIFGILGVWLSFPVAELFTLLITLPFPTKHS